VVPGQAAPPAGKKKKIAPRKPVQGQGKEVAIAPLNMDPAIEYIELRDVDRNMEIQGYISRHLKKEEKDYTGSYFKISTEGYERLLKIYIEVEKRTPESNGIIHSYTDFRGYGIIEVIQKQVMDYEKECRQASPDLLKLFFIVEALVFFLDETYDAVWLSVDDTDGIEELISLLGAMFMDCFSRLERQYLSQPERNPLKNLGLVMGLAVSVAGDWEETGCDGGSREVWSNQIRRLGKRQGVQLMDSRGPLAAEAVSDFAMQFEEYKKRRGRGGMGGTFYDLSKVPPDYRREVV